MKVGSLVECVKLVPIPEKVRGYVSHIPEIGEIFTVRDISELNNRQIGIIAEEVSFGFCPLRGELYAEASCFRELQPPMDISELIEECQSLVLTPSTPTP